MRFNSLVLQTSLADGGTFFTLESEDGDEISIALEQLLSWPQDEELMDQAKATGRLLFADLAPEARKQRIDTLVNLFTLLKTILSQCCISILIRCFEVCLY